MFPNSKHRLVALFLNTFLLPLAVSAQYSLPLNPEDCKSDSCYVTAYPDHDDGHDWNGDSVRYGGHHGTDIGIGGYDWQNFPDAGYRPVRVIAASDGQVVEADDTCRNDKCTDRACECEVGNGFGNSVRIQDKFGRRVIYGHMVYQSVAVKKGDEVKAGDFLGLVGASGHADGPHLHFEVREGSFSPDAAVDPFAGDNNRPITLWIQQGLHADGGRGQPSEYLPSTEKYTCAALPGEFPVASEGDAGVLRIEKHCSSNPDAGIEPCASRAFQRGFGFTKYSGDTEADGGPLKHGPYPRLGCPYNPEGNAHRVVHEVNGVWLQDFIQNDRVRHFDGSDDGWTALIYNGSESVREQEAFLLRSGFWGSYKCIELVPGTAMGGAELLGAPLENEHLQPIDGRIGTVEAQRFAKNNGLMWWDPTEVDNSDPTKPGRAIVHVHSENPRWQPSLISSFTQNCGPLVLQHNPGATDEPCKSKVRGWYCGALLTGYTGDIRDRVYCSDDAVARVELCGAGCDARPAGSNDVCRVVTCPAGKNCSSRDCGADPVCGLSCGSCASGEECSLFGTCMPVTASSPPTPTLNALIPDNVNYHRRYNFTGPDSCSSCTTRSEDRDPFGVCVNPGFELDIERVTPGAGVIDLEQQQYHCKETPYRYNDCYTEYECKWNADSTFPVSCKNPNNGPPPTVGPTCSEIPGVGIELTIPPGERGDHGYNVAVWPKEPIRPSFKVGTEIYVYAQFFLPAGQDVTARLGVDCTPTRDPTLDILEKHTETRTALGTWHEVLIPIEATPSATWERVLATNQHCNGWVQCMNSAVWPAVFGGNDVGDANGGACIISRLEVAGSVDYCDLDQYDLQLAVDDCGPTCRIGEDLRGFWRDNAGPDVVVGSTSVWRFPGQSVIGACKSVKQFNVTLEPNRSWLIQDDNAPGTVVRIKKQAKWSVVDHAGQEIAAAPIGCGMVTHNRDSNGTLVPGHGGQIFIDTDRIDDAGVPELGVTCLPP